MGKHIIFSEVETHLIRRFTLATGQVSTFAGTQDSKPATFRHPRALCPDPLKPDNFYVGDYTCIRYWDTATNQVTLIAGDEKYGYADGVGSNAQFQQITGLLCHPKGKTLFVCDSANHLLKMVDLSTRLVISIAGDRKAGNRVGTGVNSSFMDYFCFFQRPAKSNSSPVKTTPNLRMGRTEPLPSTESVRW